MHLLYSLFYDGCFSPVIIFYKRRNIVENLKKFTHIMFSVLLGALFGGIITERKSVWVTCLILLILDVIVGITLQYLLDNPKTPTVNNSVNEANFNNLAKTLIETNPLEESNNSSSSANYFMEFVLANAIDINKEFNIIFSKFVGKGFQSIAQDDASISLLQKKCSTMIYSPNLTDPYIPSKILAKYFSDSKTIIYRFPSQLINMIGQTQSILLIQIKYNSIRLFTIETNSPPCLCEYSHGSHLNYGPIPNDEALNDVLNRILI